MSVPAKLAAFGALLIVVFVAALGVGAAVGPIDPATPTHVMTHDAPDDGVAPNTNVTANAPEGSEHSTSGDQRPTTLPGTSTTSAGVTTEPHDHGPGR